MSASGLALIALAALLTAAANILLAKGIASSGGLYFDGFSEFTRGSVRLLATPAFGAGFVTYFLAAIVWFRILSSEPLGIAYPLLVSSTFALVTLASIVLIGETMTWWRLCGLIVTVLGIVIISRS